MRNVNVLASNPVLLLGHFPFLSMVALIWDNEVDWLSVTSVVELFQFCMMFIYTYSQILQSFVMRKPVCMALNQV